jgi:uncharacterized protein YjeT (DUF2065 family)
MLVGGMVLIILGLLPVIFPTTYFRISPLAIPVRAHQNPAVTASFKCEVCGEPAAKLHIMPYEAEINWSGEYIGYDPRRWPGNSIIPICEKHLDYSQTVEGKRLTRGALLYLLFHGDNNWLRLVLFVHLFMVVEGCLLAFKSRTAKRSEGNGLAEQTDQAQRR